MIFRNPFQETGYNASSDFSKAMNDDSFTEGIVRSITEASQATGMPDPEVKTIGKQTADGISNTFDSAMSGKGPTAYEQVTGESLNVNTSINQATLQSGSNANANLQASATTSGLKANAQAERGVAVAAIEKEQAPIKQALEQAGGNEAMESFAPPQKTHTTTIATTTASAAIGGPVGGAIALNDLRRAMGGKSGKLSSEQECTVAKAAIDLCSPPKDSNGTPIENGQPAIANNYNIEALQKMPDQELVQCLKEFCKPPEQHAEILELDNMINELDNIQAVHQKHENTDHAVAALAENAGVDTADVDAGGVAVQSAQNTLDAIKAENPVSVASVSLFTNELTAQQVQKADSGFSTNMTDDGIETVKNAVAELNLQVPESMRNLAVSNDSTYNMSA